MNSSSVSVSSHHNRMNQELYERNIPSQMLQPYLEVRPVMTKYSHLPIVDPRRKDTVTPLTSYPTFETNQIFNPGNTQSPWSGFAANVNVESELRNQIYALQKCSQAVYVPQSTSDLYQPTVNKNAPAPASHSLLFEQPAFSAFDPNPDPRVVGFNLFNNNTRQQVRDLTDRTDCKK